MDVIRFIRGKDKNLPCSRSVSLKYAYSTRTVPPRSAPSLAMMEDRSGWPVSSALLATLHQPFPGGHRSALEKAGTSTNVFISIDTISYYNGRVDTYLYVDGVNKQYHLTQEGTNGWGPVRMSWGGAVSAGTHTISVRSSQANIGCEHTWGSITSIIFD